MVSLPPDFNDMSNRLQILQHSLGLDRYGDGLQYRNHFVCGPGSKDFDTCRSIVADNLMTERHGHALSGNDSVFHVTRKGIDFVAINSPKRPPEPKLTRSQKRYRDYLQADCGWTFAEWLGVAKPKW